MRLSAWLGLLGVLVTSEARADAHGRFAIGGGFLLPTTFVLDGSAIDAAPGPLLLLSFDRPLSAEWTTLDGGLFLNVGQISAGRDDAPVNFVDIGLATHWIHPLTETLTLRVGGGLGYRQMFATPAEFDGQRGLAVNGDAELSGPVAKGLVGLVEVGVLSQPVGGNGGHDAMWAPFPYLSLGVVF